MPCDDRESITLVFKFNIYYVMRSSIPRWQALEATEHFSIYNKCKMRTFCNNYEKIIHRITEISLI